MKKVSLLLAFAGLTATAAHAQQGSWYAGGNVGFGSSANKSDDKGTETDGSKTTSWNFSPEVGTFLTNHVQLGVGLTLQGAKTDYRTAVKRESSVMQTGATVYSRYFFGTGNFRPFVGVNAFVLPGKEKETLAAVTTETKVNQYGANLNAGFGYGLNSRITVVGSFGALGFTQTVRENEETGHKDMNSSFGLDAGSLGNRFTVGVYYTFLK